MSISNKFNLVLSNKIKDKKQKNSSVTQSYYRKNLNQTDTFESTTKNQVSFKGHQKLINVQKAFQSESYKKILSAFSVAALALWAKLTNNGEREIDLSEEDLKKLIEENLALDNYDSKLADNSERIIEVKPTETDLTSKETVAEAPKKRRGRPPKNLKLDGGKQPDTNNAVQKIRRQQESDAELIRSLTEQGLTRCEIEAQTGIKVQQIERIAKKENITLVDGRKKIKKADGIRDVKEVEEVKEKEEVKRPLAEESELGVSVKQQKTSITDEIIDKTIKLSEQKIPQQEIAKQLGISPASVCRILSGELVLGKSKAVKELREIFDKEINFIVNSLKVSLDEIFDKSIVKSYKGYIDVYGADKFLDFTLSKNNSSVFGEQTSFESIIKNLTETIPENDSIYEDYKKCFSKKDSVTKFFELRRKYIENVFNQLVQQEQFYQFKSMDNAENITLEDLLDILCKAKVSKAIEKQESNFSKLDYKDSSANAEEEIKEKTSENTDEISTNVRVNNELKESIVEDETPVVNNLAELGNDGYIKFLKGEINCNESFKNIVLQRYKNYLGGNEEISLEEAVICLKKVDEYLDLTEEEKCRIDKILEIFDYKNSKLEKKILEKIIDIEYMTKDTKIYNSYYGKDVIITTKAKEEIKNNKQRDYINILKAFESASALHSRKKNDPGVIEYFNDYSMEIRLAGNFGAMRLYSSKLCKDKNGNEIKNFIFDHFAPDH